MKIIARSPPSGGFPARLPETDRARARQAEAEARSGLEAAQRRCDQAREAIRGLSEDYHPYDLSSGSKIEACEVEKRIEGRFADIDRVAKEAELSDAARKRIEKAWRLIESFVATIAFFHLNVQMWVSELRLRAELEQIVLKELIPALYLQRVARKRPTAEDRARLMAIYQPNLIAGLGNAPSSPGL